MEPNHQNSRYWGGLIGIALLYILYSLFSDSPYYAQKVSRLGRHLLNLMAVVSVYVIGVYGLKKSGFTWMYPIWKGIHLIIIAFLILLLSYDWLSGWAYLRKEFLTFLLQEINVSLIFYVCLGILKNRLVEKGK